MVVHGTEMSTLSDKGAFVIESTLPDILLGPLQNIGYFPNNQHKYFNVSNRIVDSLATQRANGRNLYETQSGDSLRKNLEDRIDDLVSQSQNGGISQRMRLAALKDLYLLAMMEEGAKIISKLPIGVLSSAIGNKTIVWGVVESGSKDALIALIKRGDAFELCGNGKTVLWGLYNYGNADYRIALLDKGQMLLKSFVPKEHQMEAIHLQAMGLYFLAKEGDKSAEDYLFKNLWLFKVGYTNGAIGTSILFAAVLDKAPCADFLLRMFKELPDEMLLTRMSSGEKCVLDKIREYAMRDGEFKRSLLEVDRMVPGYVAYSAKEDGKMLRV